MSPTLVALLLMPCISTSYQAALSNETVIYACPNTVQYVYQSTQPVAEPAAAPAKPVAVKKATAPKKKYRKRRKRR